MISCYRRAISTSKWAVKRVDMTLSHTKNFLSKSYMKELTQRNQAFTDIKAMFELNADFDLSVSDADFKKYSNKQAI